MHRVHHWGLCPLLFESCSCPLLKAEILNIKYQPSGAGAHSWLHCSLHHPGAGIQTLNNLSGLGTPHLGLLCSSLQWKCPIPARPFSAHSSRISQGFLQNPWGWALPAPPAAPHTPTMPKPFFPLFLPQFPYLLYQHPLPRSTDLSAMVTCPDKGFFNSCLVFNSSPPSSCTNSAFQEEFQRPVSWSSTHTGFPQHAESPAQTLIMFISSKHHNFTQKNSELGQRGWDLNPFLSTASR